MNINSLVKLREFEDNCLLIRDSVFLEEKFTQTNICRINRYSVGVNSINKYTDVGCNPSAPLFHTYGILGSNSYFFAKIPNLYLNNLPLSIKSKLKELNIMNPEIYFVPQAYISNDSLQFKPSYWLYPDAPSPIPQGSYKQGNVMVGVFESTVHPLTIDGTVGMIKKSYNLHDGKVSPDHGKINIIQKNLPLAFWSIVYKEENGFKRCAVTLHWIITFEASCIIRNIIEADPKPTMRLLKNKFKQTEPYKTLVHTLDFLN